MSGGLFWFEVRGSKLEVVRASRRSNLEPQTSNIPASLHLSFYEVVPGLAGGAIGGEVGSGSEGGTDYARLVVLDDPSLGARSRPGRNGPGRPLHRRRGRRCRRPGPGARSPPDRPDAGRLRGDPSPGSGSGWEPTGTGCATAVAYQCQINWWNWVARKTVHGAPLPTQGLLGLGLDSIVRSGNQVTPDDARIDAGAPPGRLPPAAAVHRGPPPGPGPVLVAEWMMVSTPSVASSRPSPVTRSIRT